MTTEVKLPSLGENVDSGDVLSILVSEGDEIKAEQGILELETEKATVEVPSPEPGRVTKIHVSEGDTVSVGAVLLTLEPKDKPDESTEGEKKPEAEEKAEEAEEDEEAEPEPKPKRGKKSKSKPAAKESAKSAKEEPPPKAARSAIESVPQTPEGEQPGDGHSSAAAGPAVRRLARELGVDLTRVQASGASGRITREDVQAHVRESNRKVAARPAPSTDEAPRAGELAADDYGPIRRQKMSRMRQTIARNMLQSYTTIPQLTNFDDADITELEKIRQESKADYARSGVKLTTMPFLVKAVVSALKLHPIVNSSIDAEANEIIYKDYINIGIAVDTDRGLMVPVLRDVERWSVPEIARALRELGEKARSGDITLEDLRGSTFTISNLGAVGGTYSTPIINPPEAAVLLAGRARKLPVYVGDRLDARLMLPLSITYDHRLVDGAAAARFLNEVKAYLIAPGRLLLAP